MTNPERTNAESALQHDAPSKWTDDATAPEKDTLKDLEPTDQSTVKGGAVDAFIEFAAAGKKKGVQ